MLLSFFLNGFPGCPQPPMAVQHPSWILHNAKPFRSTVQRWNRCPAPQPIPRLRNGLHRATRRRGGSNALLSWSDGCRRTWSAAASQLWYSGLAGVPSALWQRLAKSSDIGCNGHAFDAVLITGSSIENGTQDYRLGATTKESLRLLCAPHATSRRCNAWKRATAGSATFTCSRFISMNGMSVQTGGGLDRNDCRRFTGVEQCWTPATKHAMALKYQTPLAPPLACALRMQIPCSLSAAAAAVTNNAECGS